MKAVVQVQRSGSLRLVDVPAPLAHDGTVRVLNCYSLISAGTERARLQLARKSLLGKARARPDQVRQVLATLRREGPIATYNKVMNRLMAFDPLGYSSAGVVVEVGDGVAGIEPGDLVACAGAGYANHAEAVSVPANLCVPLDGSSDRDPARLQSACFATLGAIALQGIRQAEVEPGDMIAVIGLGLLGLLSVQLLKHAGCVVLGIDPVGSRRGLAIKLGADAVASGGERAAQTTRSLSSGRGADRVVVTAATATSAPIELAGDVARDRARIVAVGDVGMQVPRRTYYAKELELRLSRSYGPGRYEPSYEEKGIDYPLGYVRWTERRNMRAFLETVAMGAVRIEPLISHVFSVEQAKSAYDLITSPSEDTLGVLFEYEGTLQAIHLGESQQLSAPALATRVPINGSAAAERGTGARGASVRPSAGPNPISVGLIGAGNFAQSVILPALAGDDRVRLRGVVSSSGYSAAAAAERFGFDYACSDAAGVLEEPSVDAVLIATRHGTHASLVARAVRAGKATFVEKPLATEWAGLRELRTLMGEGEDPPQQPFVQVGFNRRFSHHTAEIKSFVERSPGPVVLDCRVNAGYLAADHWLHDVDAGGGRIVGEGCHFIDLLIYLVGCRPLSLFAQSIPRTGVNTLENASVNIAFEDGSVGSLSYLTDGDRAMGKERISVSSSRGSMVLEDFRWVGERPPLLSRFGLAWLRRQDKGHRREFRAFLEAVANREMSPLPLAEAIESTLWTFGALESVRQGRPVTRSELVAALDDEPETFT